MRQHANFSANEQRSADIDVMYALYKWHSVKFAEIMDYINGNSNEIAIRHYILVALFN